MESKQNQELDEADPGAEDAPAVDSSDEVSENSSVDADGETGPDVPEGLQEPGFGQRWRRRLAAPRARKVLAACAILLLALGGGGYFWLRAGTLPDGVALRVNDRDVTVEQFEGKVRTMKALYGVQQPSDPAGQAEFRRMTAKSYALQLVLEQAGRERNVVVPDKAARDVLDRYITEQAGEGAQARAKFVEALGNAGTSEPDVVAEIKRMLQVNRLFEQTTKGSTVTDEDVRRAFPERKASLGTPETRDLRNIVVRTREDADRVLSRLRAGEPFEAVAADVSLDGQTRAAGGQLGKLEAAQLEDGYAKAAFQPPQGVPFGPVQTQHGWNVGEVLGVHPPVPAVFEQVRDQLKQQLTYEKTMDRWQKWLGDRLRAADVSYADDYRPADPDSPPKVAPGKPETGRQPPAPK
ncbi:peptidylprolyl isomerase [Saccharopolyspora sp. HNM0986]|uniref:peptidyl-prolyl cis-trans isomerase n=1 Tax=Saccharopolyspora galaxeae TaxID=2781241 RepID=UPI00190C2201|nr:peptidyl-prolyl cis-trans isomerase [Saccharopolyspora sp. HNM0986]MBK0870857.1 peptidylprolyl isomerase [Saccharopolyspora sp. HNM0986]